MPTDESAARRPWGVTVFRNAKGVPMVSLGVHVDLHTPTLDLHLPLATVQIGRNNWDGRRFAYHPPEPWNGHTDNCDHPRGCAEGALPTARLVARLSGEVVDEARVAHSQGDDLDPRPDHPQMRRDDPVREWLARSRPGPNLDAPLETPAEIMARAGVNLSVRGTGGGAAHVGHGVGCVSLTVENRGSAAGMVLTPSQARTLAASLTRQAESAKEADRDGDG